MKITIGFIIFYLIARLISGTAPQAVGMTVVLAICLLLILRIAGNGSWIGLTEWTVRHKISTLFVFLESVGVFFLGLVSAGNGRNIIHIFLGSIFAIFWFGLFAVVWDVLHGKNVQEKFLSPLESW